MQLRLLGSPLPSSPPPTKDPMSTSTSPRHLADDADVSPTGSGGASAHIPARGPAGARFRTPAVPALRAVADIGRHLLIPLFLATGMALAYLGAFHEPTPHALPTAVVGTSVEAKVFAQKLNDGAHGALTVRTVPTADDARRLIRQREISGAYQTVGDHAVLFVSPAASATTATAVTEAFAPIAYATGRPLQVQDVVPVGPADRSGQGLFFLLVALSIGGYTSAIAISAAAAHLRVSGRVGVAVVMTAVVAALGTPGGRPGLRDHHGAPRGHLGAGLALLRRHHPDRPRAAPHLQALDHPAADHAVRDAELHVLRRRLPGRPDAALLLGAARLLERRGLAGGGLVPHVLRRGDMGRPVLTLALWAAGGLGLIALSHTWSVHRNRIADEDVAVSAEEEGVLAT